MKDTILSYLHAIDTSLEILSKGQEGKISGLPSWVLQTRQIILGITEDFEGFVVKITPDENLDEDAVTIKKIRNRDDVNEIVAPVNFNGPLPNKDPNENSCMLFGDMSVIEVNNPLAIPALDQRCLMGWGRRKGFLEAFNTTKAKQEAIDQWNSAIQKVKGNSFIQEVRKVFEKCQAIAKRKAFLERRIHRFINEHHGILLPNHKKFLVEQPLYYGDKKRKADFILNP